MTKMDTKSIQNLPKITEKSSQNRFRGRLGPRSRFGTDLGSVLAPTWGRLGGQDGVMLGPCWPKIDLRRILKAFKIDEDFQHLSGPSLGQILE